MKRVTAWGIDIGRSAIKLVELERFESVINLKAADIIEYSKVEDKLEDEAFAEEVRKALTYIRDEYHILPGATVFYSLPSQGTFIRLVTVPFVGDDKMRGLLEYEAKQQIPFPLDEVIWDYQILNDDFREKGELEANIFAVKKAAVDAFLSLARSLSLPVTGLQVTPLALFNFLSYDQELQGARVFVSVGAESTELLVIDSNRLWSRHIAWAGKELTRLLADKLGVSFEKAELLRCRAEHLPEGQEIYEIFRPGFKELLGEIHRSLGFYKSQNETQKFARFTFLGGTACTYGCDRFFSENLPNPVDLYRDLQVIRVALPGPLKVFFEDRVMSFGVALGLGVQGVGAARAPIRFLPQEMLVQEIQKRQSPYWIAVALVLFLPWVVIYFQNRREISRWAAVYQQIAPVVELAGQGAMKLQEWQGYTGQWQQQWVALEALGKERTWWPLLFDRLLSQLPANDRPQVFTESGMKIAEEEKKVWLIALKARLVNQEMQCEYVGGMRQEKQKSDTMSRIKNEIVQPIVRLGEIPGVITTVMDPDVTYTGELKEVGKKGDTYAIFKIKFILAPGEALPPPGTASPQVTP